MHKKPKKKGFLAPTLLFFLLLRKMSWSIGCQRRSDCLKSSKIQTRCKKGELTNSSNQTKVRT
jgi:hypothetical protein